ncbi:hypothetical protein RN001_006338 [Aquatica leii]|uniref:Calponin-homology (CH) domain-containing protein n=1 Tax=Aquatica leii TaxID=1421715 RepID=A0AAN7SJR6_9COLE|nr:hypothetical protein RN001_006338 [Aquatica leii]
MLRTPPQNENQTDLILPLSGTSHEINKVIDTVNSESTCELHTQINLQQENDWKIVSGKKNKRNSPENTERNTRQKLLTEYKQIVNPINKFQLLENITEIENETSSSFPEIKNINIAKTKPPPLFLAMQNFTQLHYSAIACDKFDITMKLSKNKRDSRQLDESDYRSKNGDNVLRLWNSTLQILLPVAALAVIWGRRGLFTRFLLQFNKNCISVFCPSVKDKQRLLDWIHYYISNKWFFYKDTAITTSVEFWKNGSLLCSLINNAIPGACSNPQRHWQHPPSHGQALAYKYLGIAPIFTERELSVKYLTEKQKKMLDEYINKLQQAVTKSSLQDFKFSSTYIAKGMGLVSGEQFRKMYFYIYLNVPVSHNSGDIVINIRAPSDVYHTLSIPFCSIKKTIIQKPLPTIKNYPAKFQQSFFRSVSVDSETTDKLCHKQSNIIPVMFLVENDRVKVIYIPQHSGIYEISIITNGFHLLGSPFPVSISENTSNVYDNFNETDINTNANRTITKKIVSAIIDFLDTKTEKDDSDLLLNSSTYTKNAKLEDKTGINNCNNIISSICFDHIEPEVRNDLKAFLVLKKNQSKDESKDDELQILSKSLVDKTNLENNKNRSLNILNYLSHFKDEKHNNKNKNQSASHYRNIYHNKSNSESSYSLCSYEIQSCNDFNQVLQFWKTQSELNLTKNKKIIEQCHSLPNLDSINFVDQKLSNSTNTETATKLSIITKKQLRNIHNYSRYSLPDVFADKDWIESKIDDYMDGLEFRKKFRECLNYWERLCSHSNSTDNLSLQSSDDDSIFDYSITSSNLFCRNEYLHSLFTDTYNNAIFEETRKYWENVSSFNLNDMDKSVENEVIPKRSNIALTKTKQQLLQFISKLDSFEKQKQHYATFEYDLQHNLTDDLKCINNYRENIKKRFIKNKFFFQSLEGIVR